MPQDNTVRVLKVVAVALLLVAMASVWFFTLQVRDNSPEAPAPETKVTETTVESERETVVPRAAPADSQNTKEVVKIQAPEPEPLTENVEARIQDIADRIGRGEITREEGQRQINELLGI